MQAAQRDITTLKYGLYGAARTPGARVLVCLYLRATICVRMRAARIHHLYDRLACYTQSP